MGALSPCDTFRRDAWRMYDREPGGMRVLDLEAHAAICASCDAWNASYRRTVTVVRGLAQAEPEPVAEELVRRIVAGAASFP